jgi:hypothetical protein
MRSSRGSSGRIAGARTEIRTRSINRQGLIARIKVFSPAAEVYGPPLHARRASRC